MNLLSVHLARSIWLFPLNDLNPRGKTLYPLLFNFLVHRYSFAKFPLTAEHMDEEKGIKFERGNFSPRSGQDVNLTTTGTGGVIVNATIYSDGLIADTRSSTEDSDAFLADALNAVSQEYGLTPPAYIKKAYVSEVYVQTQHSLNLVNEKLRHFVDRLSQEVTGFGKQSWETSGITFSVEQATQPKPTHFRFERAVNAADNRYYSIAPMQTEKHLKMLDDLEIILRGDS